MLKSYRSSKHLVRALGLLPLLASAAMAQSKGYQGQCRTKAKETAKVAYDQCMSFAKDNEAEMVRQEYKAKLAKLKSVYEQKLKRVVAQKKNSAGAGVVPVTTVNGNTAPGIKTALSGGEANTMPSTSALNNTMPATNTTTTTNTTPSSNSVPTTDAPVINGESNSNSLVSDSGAGAEPSIQLKEAPTTRGSDLEMGPDTTL